MKRETVRAIVRPTPDGFIVHSKDKPEMNLFVKKAGQVDRAVLEALEYLYRHNDKMQLVEMTFSKQPVEKEAAEIRTYRCKMEPLP